jgi:Restriction alleviation protein Lar
MSIELKPCPFCGAEVAFEEVASKVAVGIVWSIMCPTEDCILWDALPGLYPTRLAAATAWNKRV